MNGFCSRLHYAYKVQLCTAQESLGCQPEKRNPIATEQNRYSVLPVTWPAPGAAAAEEFPGAAAPLLAVA